MNNSHVNPQDTFPYNQLLQIFSGEPELLKQPFILSVFHQSLYGICSKGVRRMTLIHECIGVAGLIENSVLLLVMCKDT